METLTQVLKLVGAVLGLILAYVVCMSLIEIAIVSFTMWWFHLG